MTDEEKLMYAQLFLNIEKQCLDFRRTLIEHDTYAIAKGVAMRENVELSSTQTSDIYETLKVLVESQTELVRGTKTLMESISTLMDDVSRLTATTLNSTNTVATETVTLSNEENDDFEVAEDDELELAKAEKDYSEADKAKLIEENDVTFDVEAEPQPKPKRKYTKRAKVEEPKIEQGGTVFSEFETLNLNDDNNIKGNSVELPHVGPSYNDMINSYNKSPLAVIR